MTGNQFVLCRSILTWCVVGIGASPAIAQTTYEIIDLGTLGGELANGLGINEAGDVVGQAELPNLAVAPFVWRNNGPMELFGSLNEQMTGRANRINNLGHIVGSSGAPVDLGGVPVTISHAFLWTPKDGMIDLTPGSTVLSRAWGIDDDGNIGMVFAGAKLREPDGNLIDINLPDSALPGSTDIFDMSATGFVVGGGWNATPDFRGYRFHKDQGIDELLPLPGGEDSDAFGVNDSGQVVGFADADTGANMPARWDPGDNNAVFLGLLPPNGGIEYAQGWAEAINNHGVIVGEDFPAQPGELTEAWIWIDGEKTRLEDLISPEDAAEWDITWALDLNDAGEITGIGVHTIDGTPFFGRAFLMRPIDDSIPGDLDGDGTVGPTDLAIVLGNWGPCPPPPADCPADLTGDGAVGPADLAIVLGNWG